MPVATRSRRQKAAERRQCPAESELVNFSAGDLPGAARQRIARHLKKCRECAREAELVRRLTPASAASSKARESRLYERVRSAATKRRPARRAASRGRIELLGAMQKVGDAWTSAPPVFARKYRGSIVGGATERLMGGPDYVPVVVGMILDKEGKRLARRVVRLHRSGARIPIITRTDEAGHFRFLGVEPGEYELKAGQMTKKVVVIDPRSSVTH